MRFAKFFIIISVMIITFFGHVFAKDSGSQKPKSKQIQKKSKTIVKKDPLLELRERIRKASQSRASVQERKSCIKQVEKFIETQTELKLSTKESLMLSIANLHTQNKEIEKASGVYLDLALNINPSKKVFYLRKAIILQSIQAKWPQKISWDLKSHKSNTARLREELLAGYRQLESALAVNSRERVDVATQIILLELSLDRKDQAVELIETSLQKNALGIHSKAATAYLLIEYRKESNWEKLEQYSKLCLQKKIIPQLFSKSYSCSNYLADALYFPAKAANDANDFSSSVTKLQEFDKKFNRDARHVEVLYWLAKALRQLSKPTDSLDTYTRYAQIYALRKEAWPALNEAVEQAESMAAEEQSIFYLKKILEHASKFNREDSTYRYQLSQLYLAAGDVESASNQLKTLLTQNSKRKKSSEDLLVKSELDFITIESRFSSAARAESNLSLVRKSSQDPSNQAYAWAESVKLWEQNKNVKALQVNEGLLRKLGESNKEFSSAYGQLLLALAREKSKKTKEEFFNLSVKDPFKLLEEKFRSYNQAMQYFDAVCNANEDLYCAPAQFEAARIADAMNLNIESLEIAQTLSEDVVKKFEARKKEIIQVILQRIQNSDQKALSLARAGKTIPEWALEIFWENNYDYPFDRVSGETAQALIQLYPRVGMRP